MFVHYFSTREEAELIVDYLWSIPYELRHNEACRPSYKIVKERNKSLWKIRCLSHYYGPKDFVSWFSVAEYNDITCSAHWLAYKTERFSDSNASEMRQALQVQ